MFLANGLHVPELVGTYPFRVTYGLPGGENDPPGNKGPVEVGCEVWIGFDAMIASGEVGQTLIDGEAPPGRAVRRTGRRPSPPSGGRRARWARWGTGCRRDA